MTLVVVVLYSSSQLPSTSNVVPRASLPCRIMSWSCLFSADMRTSASRSSAFRRAARCFASASSRGLDSTAPRAEAVEALLWVRRWVKLGVGEETLLRLREWPCLGCGILLGEGDRGDANEAVEARGGWTDGEAASERRLEGRREFEAGVVERREVGTLMRRPVAIDGAVFRDRGDGRNDRR